MSTISVPSAAGLQLLGELPAGSRGVVWDGTGPAPADVEFLVPPYMVGGPPALVGMPQLKVVQLLSAGVEGWPERVPAGVTLCNGRGVHGGSTAELAIAGLLALLHELPTYIAQQPAHLWQRASALSLDGRRALVLGAGDIGSQIAAVLRIFGAEVTSVARRPRPDVRALSDLPQLLPETEVLVIALPLTPQTAGLIDAQALALLPTDAIVVNIARGALVDTEALLSELQAGRLSAFLDVVDPEPLPAEHPLWDAPNLILTPHAGGGSAGWDRRGFRLVREQFARFVAGQPLANVVDEGY